MPRQIFTVQNGHQTAEIIADTDYSGASVHIFDEWRTPAQLDELAAKISESAQYLRDNGVQ